MVEIKRFSSCSLTDALEAWNNGFKGYYTNMTMTMERFLHRFVQEGFSADDSVIAYVDGVPIGIVLNGFRKVGEETISYNGGTGVAPEYRRSGIGRKMMQEAVEIYRENNVTTATLEAITDNHAAIELYQSLGYEITNRVEYLQQNGVLQLDLSKSNGFSYEVTTPEEVHHLSFYDEETPWQTQWQSVSNGIGLVVSYENKKVGYSLYRRLYDENGNVSTIVLHQAGVAPGFFDEQSLIKSILSNVLEPTHSCKRLVINLSVESALLYETLKQYGFEPMVAQVCMKKTIKEPAKRNAESVGKI